MTKQLLTTLYLTSVVAAALAACSETEPSSSTPGSSPGTANSNANATGAAQGDTGTVGGAAPLDPGSAASGTTGGSGGSVGSAAESPEAPDLAAAGAAGALNEPVTPVVDVRTNPFVVAKHDPLSTFAADVDTASYDAFRSYAQNGLVLDPARIRLEEFVNYFDYGYPAAASNAELPFSIALAAAPSPFNTATTVLRVGIQGKEAPPLERKPTNLVFLVDVSGSMQSAVKLPLVQQVLRETVEILNDQDTISIVTYAGDTRVRLPPTPASEREVIVAEINALSASGSTAGAAGLDLAYQQAEAGFLEDGLNHIILCTDGDFNVGPSSTAALVELVEEKRRGGVTLTVLGFGAGNNDELMEGISNAGNGVYGNITDSEQASRYVEERLLATLVHIAKDVKLQVEFNSELVHAYRLLGYENRAIADQDFRDDVIDAGEIGSGHRVTALYELVVDESAIPQADGAPEPEDGATYDGPVEVDADDWVLVKIRFKEPGTSETDPATEIALSLGGDELTGTTSDSDADFRWAVAVAGFAEILKQSPYAPVDHLQTIEELINDPAYEDDADKQELVRLFTAIRPQLE